MLSKHMLYMEVKFLIMALPGDAFVRYKEANLYILIVFPDRSLLYSRKDQF